ncbi:hypothetical protein Tco_0714798 [Tanacetum coccineum]
MLLAQVVQRSKLLYRDKRHVLLTHLIRLIQSKWGNSNLVGADLKLTPIPSTSNVVLKKVDDPVEADSDSEVEVVYKETTNFMVLMSSKVNNLSKNASGVGNKRLYGRWKSTDDDNPYDDDFDDCGLTDTHLAFANGFDISLHGQIK